MLGRQAFEETPARHYTALLMSLFPYLCNWAKLGNANEGIQMMGQAGGLVFSVMITWLFCLCIDSDFLKATILSFAAFGYASSVSLQATMRRATPCPQRRATRNSASTEKRTTSTTTAGAGQCLGHWRPCSSRRRWACSVRASSRARTARIAARRCRKSRRKKMLNSLECQMSSHTINAHVCLCVALENIPESSTRVTTVTIGNQNSRRRYWPHAGYQQLDVDAILQQFENSASQ